MNGPMRFKLEEMVTLMNVNPTNTATYILQSTFDGRKDMLKTA
jgi:hypothetical protein